MSHAIYFPTQESCHLDSNQKHGGNDFSCYGRYIANDCREKKMCSWVLINVEEVKGKILIHTFMIRTPFPSIFYDIPIRIEEYGSLLITLIQHHLLLLTSNSFNTCSLRLKLCDHENNPH